MGQRSSPPGWPQGLPPPEVEGWEQEAVRWLLDTGPSHVRLDPFLSAQPVLVARLRSAELIRDALTGRRWVPRL